MKVLIIEDEIPAQRYLKNIIKEIKPKWEFLFPLQSVEEGIEFFKEEEVMPDLIFMDIQLTDGISFEILEKVTIKIPIIFVTAYDEYALRAFQVNSIDYLLKPTSIDAVKVAIERFEEQLNVPLKSEVINEVVQSVKNKEKVYRKRLWAIKSNSLDVALVNDIACFYSENKQTHLLSLQKDKAKVDITMDKLEDELSPKQFFRINRQYIVNVDAVQGIEPFYNSKWVLRLKVDPSIEIVIPKEKVTKFKNWVVD
ncbi:LytR/AlgR family response regulator transcription factor [Flammeovirga kamogawensis]|uniref:LytTR family DNA-binding domain-containing protein n=1 Tax=Flammeovirga kamogawensis TaxID=373891 RepID=A0ABX8H3N9_9BACT|nr:LytTR family DNA-binding domain-containing protein [Flammeovirga kamogawensis]MBB6460229.1 DNA-binding LytR/AlgR family response regulator [Flammeovirga kamogawensis]QWG10041.1 LytTR family DNA-binding domain-containing protein [Flammeovirga kamogawensis]TRX65548.1 response regulator transcription factor [Flammeovirga kamogawensis]